MVCAQATQHSCRKYLCAAIAGVANVALTWLERHTLHEYRYNRNVPPDAGIEATGTQRKPVQSGSDHYRKSPRFDGRAGACEPTRYGNRRLEPKDGASLT